MATTADVNQMENSKTHTRYASPSLCMPAEWEPHACCWMGWPERPDNWRLGGGPARAAFADVAAAIARFEPVRVCVPRAQAWSAEALLPSKHANVSTVEMEMDDAWLRDTGPTFVWDMMRAPDGASCRLAGVSWQFNAWGGDNGGCYANWDRDSEVASNILKLCAVPQHDCPMILEGGSIHVDGEGTLLTTEECLLNGNRNPHMLRAHIETQLHEFLGVSKVIWLPRGLYGDNDTNGHIDNLACFVRPGEVILSWTDDEEDPQHEISQEALRILEGEIDAMGRSLKVHKLPLPPPLYISHEEASSVEVNNGSLAREPGDRLAASYVNFYFAGSPSTGRKGIVMPEFGVPDSDSRARLMLQSILPEREVVGVPSREILLGGGNIHCITQQQPTG